MNITDTQLQQIEEYSALFLSPREISCLIGIDHDIISDYYHDKKSLIHLAYFRGKTKSKAEIRQKTIPLAKLGSPHAQSLADQYIDEQERGEILYE